MAQIIPNIFEWKQSSANTVDPDQTTLKQTLKTLIGLVLSKH